MTATTAHTAVTVTARDLATLLYTASTTIPGTRLDTPPALVYVARGLTTDDLIEADSDSGYGIVGDVEGAVRTATAQEAEGSDDLVTMIDKTELVAELMAGGTLPQIAGRLTGMAREGWWA